MLHGLGVHTRTSTESNENDLVRDGVKYLLERSLNNDDSTEMCTKVFDTFIWLTGMELQNFGVQEIKLNVQHFQVQCASPNMNFENIKCTTCNEWYEFKVLWKGTKCKKLLNEVVTNRDKFPLSGKLISIVSVIPAPTVALKQGFSKMSVNKNNFKLSMRAQSLNDLMLISVKGSSAEEFNPSNTMDQWHLNAKSMRICMDIRQSAISNKVSLQR
jgi:hypothetical protein